MNIYYISYDTNPNSKNPNQLQIKTIPCSETLKNYCWPGRRLSKSEVNIIHSSSYHSSNISLNVYSTSLDILDTFKKQVQTTLLHNLKSIQKEFDLSAQNLLFFINKNKTQNINILNSI